MKRKKVKRKKKGPISTGDIAKLKDYVDQMSAETRERCRKILKRCEDQSVSTMEIVK